MKKLLYLLALPIGLGLLWGFTVDVVDVGPKNNDLSISQDQPFIQRTNLKTDKGYTSEQITLNTVNGKPTNIKIGYSGEAYQKAEVWVYINDKLYSEEDAQKFDKNYIAKLSEKRGYGSSKDYNLPVINANKFAYVFWFGNEPKLSDYTAKNRMYWEKYNGKIVSGEIIDFSFDNNKNLNGFLVKTTTGDKVMANVEIKFNKEINAMIVKGDKVTLKIYNASYWKDTAYPVLTSYKISKGGKLLYDRWPKTASNKTTVNNKAANVEQNKTEIKPILISSSRISIDSKSNISYITNGIMKIFGGLLEAKEIIFDQKNNKVIANIGSLKNKNGDVIKGEIFTFDLIKATIDITKSSGNVNSSKISISGVDFEECKLEKVHFSSLAANVVPNNDLLSKFNLKARDSVVNSKYMSTLYGKAIFNFEGVVLNGDKIEFDKKSYNLIAHNAELSGVDKNPIKAKTIYYNPITKKGKAIDILLHNGYWDRIIN